MRRANVSNWKSRLLLFASKALNCKALNFYKEKQKKKTLASIGKGSLVWKVNLF